MTTTPLPPVYLTRVIPENGMELLRTRCHLEVSPHDRVIRKEELLRAVRSVEGLVCMLTDPVDEDVIDAAPRLCAISCNAVGYNNIDIAAAQRRGIVVTNTPGVLTDATADIAFALLLACARRITEGDRWMRTHTFDGWSPMQMLGLDLVGATLGIIGAGRIGRALAQRCRGAWGMEILYHGRRRNDAFEKETGAEFVSVERLVREADIISLHVPLTPETHHMIGRAQFAEMKPHAVLINTARGPVVDEQALIEALHARRIFAAGLDVYEQEPQVPGELLALDNVVVLPHIGSASFKTRARMAEMAARNLIDVLEGREPAHRVV